MAAFNRLSIQSKLILILLIVSISSICVVGYLGYQHGQTALTNTVFNHLTDLRETKARQMTSYVHGVRQNTAVLAQGPSVAEALRALRHQVLPILALLLFLTKVLGEAATTTPVRLVQTLLWISVIHTGLASLNALLFGQAEAATWRARTPKLFLDLTRLLLIGMGSAVVLSTVWNINLGSLFTALGIGSMVLGLALQDTLDNVMSGIALLFERPFAVGDWVQIGDHIGKVTEMNWRSVRLETPMHKMIVAPNLVLGRETITNLSQPVQTHPEVVELSFSYQDPPNRVKRT